MNPVPAKPTSIAKDIPEFDAAERPPAIYVDEFDEPYNRTAGLMAVLQALAEAKSLAEDQHDGDMWSGIAEMTARAHADVRTMNEQFTQAANYIHQLEHRAVKPKKGGAR